MVSRTEERNAIPRSQNGLNFFLFFSEMYLRNLCPKFVRFLREIMMKILKLSVKNINVSQVKIRFARKNLATWKCSNVPLSEGRRILLLIFP